VGLRRELVLVLLDSLVLADSARQDSLAPVGSLDSLRQEEDSLADRRSPLIWDLEVKVGRSVHRIR